MGGEWKTARFEQMAVQVHSLVQPTEVPELPYIGLEHIGEGSLRLIGFGVAEDATSSKLKFAKGDILFGKLRPYFRKVIRAPFNGICSTDIWVIQPREGVDHGYLFYLIASDLFIEPVVRASEGTKMPRAKWEYAASLEFPLPPLPEQRAIAHILGTLDDKIELNRWMNETLEQMARAIFKSWFIDFDPVRAKCRGALQCAPTGGGKAPVGWQWPQHILDLFPDRLVQSELGEIPEGWRVGRIDDEFDLTMGQSPPGETYNENGEGMPFYQERADFGVRFPKRRVYCTEPTRLARKNDTLISVRAPVGDINMAGEDCAIGRGVASARHKSGSRSYTYQFMLGLEEVFARFEAGGTVFGSISKKDFHAIPCVVSPVPVVRAFEALLEPVDSRIEILARETETLAALRDTLLPKLISGEIRIKDAEKLIHNISLIRKEN